MDRPIIDDDPMVAGVDVSDTYKRVAYNTGLTWAQFLANSKVGRGVAGTKNFESARLVAGGFRINKTSSQENESGVLRAAHFPRGTRVYKSIK